MTIDFQICTAHESYFDALIALGKTHYKPDSPVLDTKYLKWLYLDNTYGPAILITAREEDLWVGVIALIPILLEKENKKINACYAVNVLTHPNYRSQKLFSIMIDYAREYLKSKNIWLLGHPNVSAVAGWQRQKMRFRKPLHYYFTKFRPFFSGIKEKRINDFAELQKITPEFWNSSEYKNNIHVKIDPLFINWRYLKAPHIKYKVSAVYKNNKLIGLKVSRNFKWLINLITELYSINDMKSCMLSGFSSPCIFMHSGSEDFDQKLKFSCFKIPRKKETHFFLTTWDQTCIEDISAISLSASDF